MVEDRTQVNRCMDKICQLGCDAVRNIIDAIEEGKKAEEVSSLTDRDKKRVLIELKEIMAVYDVEDAESAQK